MEKTRKKEIAEGMLYQGINLIVSIISYANIFHPVKYPKIVIVGMWIIWGTMFAMTTYMSYEWWFMNTKKHA